ncbi:FAD/NAD(P)-binding domain-containing protein [Melanomma pulvis-pyrius CBS 109.77]|uniref:FAD/NAD(P)-binding domain-containing protein n=1 Tax=Melanomma pulvis-pyrius CBS 109.77 TaxID=1314802 RepID=A0A6A6X6J3_9PLEO|nr:FAD/NAD(P)-binding domain-containing protein [Melanomma pulvis-pyrius CBS 109.77]
MTRQDARKYAVIIVGAGPVGLLLACELALANVSTLVLEKNATLADPWRDGALGFRLLNHPSAETFYRRGLLSKVIATETELTPGERKPGDFPVASHFAGIVIHSNNVDWSRWKHILPGPSAFGGAVKQGQLVGVLYQRAKDLGVEILFNCPVTRFEDTGTNVKVWTGPNSALSNGTTTTTDYLIGADGGRSFVRRHAGFTMEGNEATWTGYMADCDLSTRSKELLPPGFHRTKKGAYAVRPPATFALDFDDSVSNNGNGKNTQRPDVTREGFEAVLRRVVGREELTVETLHLSGSFTDRAKLVTEFRRGRILLAGDSAHIHSPLGGQGLNLGLADAMNLGWKVAAVAKGLAHQELLDTYDKERRPIATEVLEMIRAHTSAIMPGVHGDAIYNLAKQMIATRDGSTLFASKFIWFHPRVNLGEGCKHWLVGLSSPDFDFADGTRMGDKMAGGTWVVVDFSQNGDIARFLGGLEGFVYTDSDAKETLGLQVVMARPDGVVAWATDDKHVDIVLQLKEARARWLK